MQAADIEQIAGLLAANLQQRLAAQELDLQLDASVIKLLAEAGFDVEYGARPLKRAVVRLLEDPLSESLLAQQFVAGDVIWAWAVDGQVYFGKELPADLAQAAAGAADGEAVAVLDNKQEPKDNLEDEKKEKGADKENK